MDEVNTDFQTFNLNELLFYCKVVKALQKTKNLQLYRSERDQGYWAPYAVTSRPSQSALVRCSGSNLQAPDDIGLC